MNKSSLQLILKRFWPQLCLLGIVFFLFLTNFKQGTYLTGWDNLHPEFAFGTNIKRSLFAVWQEYQGLGLLSGMGHASDLLRQLLLVTLSSVFPPDVLRYFWTFLMLFSGSVGMYYFLNRYVFKNNHSFLSFIGGAYYLLNLATIQTFFVPFEAFIAHFGFLPWMLLASLLYLEKRSPRRLFFLVAVLFLATPAAYIPTLFIVYLLALALLIGSKFLLERKKTLIGSSLRLGLIVFVVNAFWLLPFLYFTATSSQVNLNSKINQMATQTIYLQNKEFGGITDTMLLKGFWFNNVDPDLNQVFTYMLAPWREHYAKGYVPFLGFLLFGVILVGLITILRRRQKEYYPYVVLLLFCLTVLAVATPPFSFINLLYRQALPLLNQAFRFPFTKFALLTAFSYAILLSIGLAVLSDKLAHKYHRRKTLLVVGFLSLLALLLTAFPVFKGHLFYEKERLAIPTEYFSLFEFFSKQDPSSRIANFPQHTFWGWNFYDWGYGGSGFLWYGIKQPILDRAFDVWSPYDENYYYEISQALYAKDALSLERVLQKYQISWLLIDRHVVNPISPKALYLNELETLLSKLSTVSKEQQFGKLSIYRVNLTDKPKDFIFASTPLPTVNSYTWNHDDVAYAQLGNYQVAPTPEILYPFRSLSSHKTVSEQDYTVSLSPSSITLTPKQPLTLTTPAVLTFPSYPEQVIPVTLKASVSGGLLRITARVSSPEVWDGTERLVGDSVEQEILVVARDEVIPEKTKVSVNGIVHLELQDGVLGTTFLSLEQDNLITVGSGSAFIEQQTIPASQLRSLPELQAQTRTLAPGDHLLKVVYPRIDDSYLGMRILGSAITRSLLCDEFRSGQAQLVKGFDTLTLVSTNATACASFYMPSLPHNQSYLVAITQRSLQGRGLHFWVLNQDTQYAPLDTYLPTTKSFQTSSFIVPPQEDFGQAYSFHFDNASIGNDRVENEIKDVSVIPLPYGFLTRLVVSGKPPVLTTTYPLDSVSHPHEGVYQVKALLPKDATLVLSQAYDAGWQAYLLPEQPFLKRISQVFPISFTARLTEHVKVNNWENGWVIPHQLREDDELIIVYLPQYLEYAGFALLLGCLGIVLYKVKRDA